MYALVHFRVEEFERWKAALDERAAVRAEHGCRGGTVFTRHDSDRRPVLLTEWDSREAAEAYFDGEDFEDAMRGAGVRNKPDVTLLEHVGDLDVGGDDGGDGGDGTDGDVRYVEDDRDDGSEADSRR